MMGFYDAAAMNNCMLICPWHPVWVGFILSAPEQMA